MKKTILTIGLLIGVSQIAPSQWVSNYQGPSYGDNYVANTQGLAITSDDLDNAYVTGFSDADEYNTNIITIKYDSHGDTLWTRLFSGMGSLDSKGQDIAVDVSGNVYVAGYVSTLTANTDCVVLKYDPSGTLLWSRTYNGKGNSEDKAFGIAVDDAGSVYITGFLTGIRSGTNCITIKYNSEGTQQWASLYSGTGNGDDKAFGIVADNLSNIYITGYTESLTGHQDIITIKYNSSGQEIWVRTYDGPAHYNDEANSITIDASNNICVAGYVSTLTANTDCVVLKYDASGTLLWSRTYNGEGNSEDKAFGIVADDAGSVYMTGYATGISSGNDYVTIKYNPDGTQKWVSLYNGTGNGDDNASAIALSNKNVIITGASLGIFNNDDYTTIKYRATDGLQQQVSRYSMSRNSDDVARDVTASVHNKVYVTGYSKAARGAQSMSAVSTMMLSWEENSDINTLQNAPTEYALYQNYPNPFNPSTTIKFNVAKASNVKLTVYDVEGREVAILVDGFMEAGKYDAVFASTNLSSGIYFYVLTADGFRDVKKMTLVK